MCPAETSNPNIGVFDNERDAGDETVWTILRASPKGNSQSKCLAKGEAL